MKRRDGQPRRKGPATREERNESTRLSQLDLRRETFDLMGGCCKHCGNTDLRVLEIEHTKNDGGYWRKKQGHRPHLKRIRDDLREGHNTYFVEALCANCHAIKTWHSKV